MYYFVSMMKLSKWSNLRFILTDGVLKSDVDVKMTEKMKF
jgi:hypothetical protein